MLRIGQGYDLHPCVAGRELWLGGLRLPSPWGLQGHSDADALLHAIIDALLGALALGDIGQWFPDHDERWRGASSAALLRAVLADPRVSSWRLVNLDCTVIAEQPKLAPHILPMRASVAELFQCPIDRISIKAKTNEKQDAIGRGDALAALAVILLTKAAAADCENGAAAAKRAQP
jgi:2-C-methyl-D-erythritol 2,4-cyclodiphosphate synthase